MKRWLLAIAIAVGLTGGASAALAEAPAQVTSTSAISLSLEGRNAVWRTNVTAAVPSRGIAVNVQTQDVLEVRPAAPNPFTQPWGTEGDRKENDVGVNLLQIGSRNSAQPFEIRESLTGSEETSKRGWEAVAEEFHIRQQQEINRRAALANR